jgi:hydrogenase maturation protein HypF
MSAARRVSLQLTGIVQGVGFRPATSRLARALGLTGWVANSGNGVSIDIEGHTSVVDKFLQQMESMMPSLARVDNIKQQEFNPVGYTSFEIRNSLSSRKNSNENSCPSALILPDVATCDECLHEIFDANNRHYHYPFTNCTNCGPRFSILKALPYDRINTTMQKFDMCPACLSEYHDPDNRRFHAQPNACPDCGPQLSLQDRTGRWLAGKHDALLATAAAVRAGQIVAIKGLGGFQLLADARDEAVVEKLRKLKGRIAKPFALMASGMTMVEQFCQVSDMECELLTSPQAPIVLMRRRSLSVNRLSRETLQTESSSQSLPGSKSVGLAMSIAMNNPLLGFMLPNTPLHHLLLRELDFPIVVTSGNVAGLPIISDEHALGDLLDVAHLFLVHDRPIACPLDDSVVRVVAGRPLVLRCARGYAPVSLTLAHRAPDLLALGGHLKSAAAVIQGKNAVIGPYIGDLNSYSARQVYMQGMDHLQRLHALEPTSIACDNHPDYYTSSVARCSRKPVISVQHHLAHIVACQADNGIDGSVLGVAWDGTGYGDDGTIRGSEFILVDGSDVRRVAHMRLFSLPGGDKAVSEPRRAAIGLLYEVFGESALTNKTFKPVQSFSSSELAVLGQMLRRQVNTPRTSSMGRLFDAIASLIGLMQKTSYEAQAAIALEFSANEVSWLDSYPGAMEFQTVPDSTVYEVKLDLQQHNDDSIIILDWEPLVKALIKDIALGIAVPEIARAVHEAMADTIVAVAQHVGQSRVVLSGGCFQNACLTEASIRKLRQAGFVPYWHRQLPPNDGCLALGQAVWAARQIEGRQMQTGAA